MRNSKFSRLLSLALSLALTFGLTTLPGAAVTSVQAQIDPTLNVVIDGQKRLFYNVSGQQVHPVTYAGTTYLPLRAIGELMGKTVNWDNDTKTATLTSPRDLPATVGTPDANPVQQTIPAELRDDFTIVVDGAVQTFRNGNGETVYPLLYNGSNYLPLRAIGELMGKTVSWNQATHTASLSGGSHVTDADTFGPGTSQSGGQTAAVPLEQAKQTALKHAGLSASQVTFVEDRLDWDDGRQVYDIEFYTADYKEYDYEIDATTGNILSFDQDAEFYIPAPGQSGAAVIPLEQAKQIALKHAGLSVSQVTFVEEKLDRDDGRQVYDIEFYTADFREYDYEIDAATGNILGFDQDAESYRPAPAPTPGTGSGTVISKDQAIQIALAKVPGATAANVIKCRLDRDDGIQQYEIEIRVGRMEYEFEINAATGAILSMDVDD